MDLIKFETSAKNIPIHTQKTYRHTLINSIEQIYRTLRFKSIAPAIFVPEIRPFEDELIKLIQSFEFMLRSNQFLENLKQEKSEIEAQSKIFVPADKTTNMYLMEPKNYSNLLEKNVQSQYKKENQKNVVKVVTGHQKIVKNLDIEERVLRTRSTMTFFSH